MHCAATSMRRGGEEEPSGSLKGHSLSFATCNFSKYLFLPSTDNSSTYSYDILLATFQNLKYSFHEMCGARGAANLFPPRDSGCYCQPAY